MMRLCQVLLVLATTSFVAAAQPETPPGFDELIELARRHESVDVSQAWHYAEQARAAARTPRQHAVAELRRGALQRRRGDYDAALATARSGLDRARALGDDALTAEFLHLLAHIEWSATNFPAAVEHYQRAIALAEKSGLDALAARAHSGIASTYRDLDEYPRARAHYESALPLAEKAGDPKLLSDILNNFGNYHSETGDHAQAAALHRRALALREAAGNTAGIADSFFNLGSLAATAGDLEGALAYLERAQRHYEAIGFTRNLANLHHTIAGVLRQLGRTDEGLEHLRKSQQLADALATPLLFANLYREFAATHAARGDHKTAYDYQQQFITANDAARGEKTRRQVAALSVRYETERRQHEIDLLRRDQELHAAELRRAQTQRYGLLVLLVVGGVAVAAVVSRQRMKLMTERRVHEETRAAKEAAERADAFKTRLVGIASHDLKSPVAAMIGSAEALRREAYRPEEVAATAEMMASEGRRMLTLIRDLLDLAALETGRIELDRSPVAIASVARECVDALESTARVKQQQLTCTVEPEAERVCVSADPDRLRQVIANLLDNALKFTPPGRPVRVAVTSADGAVRVAVQDAGPGLTPEDYVRVFQPFQKLSARPTGGESSTGLGLSIAREIVSLHGGQMIVDSIPGQGATFGFVLPLAAA